jgi:putative hydrolase of the HAD superfamily
MSKSHAPKALVLDFDGVLRLWRGVGERAGERAEELPDGAIASVAYRTTAHEYAKLGIVTDAEWRLSVSNALGARFGGRGELAVKLWKQDRGTLADGVVGMLEALRSRCLLALLTDNTDILRSDLRLHKLDGVFDFVFCSCEIGMTKPSPALYRHVAEKINFSPCDVLVIDDQAVNLPGARSIGMQALELGETESFSMLVGKHILQKEWN